MTDKNSFQNIIFSLQEYWASHDCLIVHGIDNEVGAGTLHPMTSIRSLGPDPWRVAYVQPSRRPKDGRYGDNPNRLQHYYQFQVILKPSPDNIQELCIKSLDAIGINSSEHDIRFVEDDWENPTIGAWGLGFEVWCDGMEIMQFTYMQQIGGIEFDVIPGELTYGLERVAMYIQDVKHFKDIKWNSPSDKRFAKTYGDIYLQDEQQFTEFSLKHADTAMLAHYFEACEKECRSLNDSNLPLPAYSHCLKASHSFNLLDARGVISVTERASYIARVRALAKECSEKFLEMKNA
jgi:glycyl-tRNA synthetase alpha chain